MGQNTFAPQHHAKGGLVMKIFTEMIKVTEKELGRKKVTENARLVAYLLDSVSVAPNYARPAVIVCPGGGYAFCSDREAEPIAMQYLSMGYQVFVLYYSVAPETYPASLMELALSVKLVRDHAKEWMVDSNKIVVTGFSAGGHLACSLGMFWNREFLYKPLGVNPSEIQPNGMILCYPVISSGVYAHRGSFDNLLGEKAQDIEMLEFFSLEKQVSKYTPKTFLWHTATDNAVPVENSLLLAAELSRQQVSFELHIYPEGYHGLSLANKEVASSSEGIVESVQTWVALVRTWMENL